MSTSRAKQHVDYWDKAKGLEPTYVLDCTAPRRLSAADTPSLRGTNGPSQWQWLLRAATCTSLSRAHALAGGIRERLRMFRRSTHAAAFRARSFCDHWRGACLARRQQRAMEREK